MSHQQLEHILLALKAVCLARELGRIEACHPVEHALASFCYSIDVCEYVAHVCPLLPESAVALAV